MQLSVLLESCGICSSFTLENNEINNITARKHCLPWSMIPLALHAAKPTGHSGEAGGLALFLSLRDKAPMTLVKAAPNKPAPAIPAIIPVSR